MTKFLRLCLMLTAGYAGAAHAAVQTDPARALSGTYRVEPAHTRVLFAVNHLGFTTYYGGFTGASGTLHLDTKHPAASGLEVSVPVANITTTNAKLDGELKSDDWFAAAKFPAITFHSDHVTLTGRGSADVAGTLTMHGVTRPLTLHVTFNGAGTNPLDHAYTAGFEVTGQVKRSDFGVSKYVPLVGDYVTLIISAAFERT